MLTCIILPSLAIVSSVSTSPPSRHSLFLSTRTSFAGNSSRRVLARTLGCRMFWVRWRLTSAPKSGYWTMWVRFFAQTNYLSLCQVWGAATQLQGELIAKVRMAVPTAYGLQGESLWGNTLFDVLKWLIQQGKLIHSGINAKVNHHHLSGCTAKIVSRQWPAKSLNPGRIQSLHSLSRPSGGDQRVKADGLGQTQLQIHISMPQSPHLLLSRQRCVGCFVGGRVLKTPIGWMHPHWLVLWRDNRFQWKHLQGKVSGN